MRLYPLKNDEALIRSEIIRIGSDRRALGIFESKREVIPIKVGRVSIAIANIIKQEMISCKGDAAIHSAAISGKTDSSEVLLLGTRSVYNDFNRKIRNQGYPTLKDMSDSLEKTLNLMKNKNPSLKMKGGKEIGFEKPVIMGVLNVTEDSFFDGGRYRGAESALKRAVEMVKNGADIIDVGGESTRPGANPVSLAEETDRVIPVIEKIAAETDAVISVDTYKSQIAESALKAGAHIINDISGLTFDDGMIKTAAEAGSPVVIMHIQGEPGNMQANPHYDDVVCEISDYFEERIEAAVNGGISRDKIILDPGIGFGKRLTDNLAIIKNIQTFKKFGLPVLIGASRKSMIGMMLGQESPAERLFGTLGVHSAAVMNGADIIRVHDVKEHSDLLKVVTGIRDYC